MVTRLGLSCTDLYSPQAIGDEAYITRYLEDYPDDFVGETLAILDQSESTRPPSAGSLGLTITGILQVLKLDHEGSRRTAVEWHESHFPGCHSTQVAGKSVLPNWEPGITEACLASIVYRYLALADTWGKQQTQQGHETQARCKGSARSIFARTQTRSEATRDMPKSRHGLLQESALPWVSRVTQKRIEAIGGVRHETLGESPSYEVLDQEYGTMRQTDQTLDLLMSVLQRVEKKEKQTLKPIEHVPWNLNSRLS